MAFRRPRPRLVALLLTCAAFMPVLAAPARALDAPTLKTKLSRESSLLGGASGAQVVDLATGKVLFSRHADRSLAPASNEKLFTTATALLRFGAAGTLTTRVQADPGTKIGDDGVLRGDLYLVGGGDPTLNDIGLRTLAQELAGDAGITKVTGTIVGDESQFDRLRGSFDSGFGPDSDLGGRLGALTWGHGRFDAAGPAHAAAVRLQFFLRKQGIRLGRKPGVGTAPADPVELASLASPPMSTIIATTNQPSDNFYAETLVKDVGMRFGAAGTTKAGLVVIRAQLSTLGVRPKMVDGSGLSRVDRATPRQIVRLLALMAAEPDARQAWTASLAVVGRSGTLRKRMRGTAAQDACRAKTGTLIGVSALSGYCTAANGHTIVFSFLENGVYNLGAKRVEDRMVPAIAGFDG